MYYSLCCLRAECVLSVPALCAECVLSVYCLRAECVLRLCCFDRFDADHSGTIESSDLSNVNSALDEQLSPAEVAAPCSLLPAPYPC